MAQGYQNPDNNNYNNQQNIKGSSDSQIYSKKPPKYDNNYNSFRGSNRNQRPNNYDRKEYPPRDNSHYNDAPQSQNYNQQK